MCWKAHQLYVIFFHQLQKFQIEDLHPMPIKKQKMGVGVICWHVLHKHFPHSTNNSLLIHPFSETQTIDPNGDVMHHAGFILLPLNITSHSRALLDCGSIWSRNLMIPHNTVQ